MAQMYARLWWGYFGYNRTMDGIMAGAHARQRWPGETGRQGAIQGEAYTFIPVHFTHWFSEVP